MSIRPEYLRRSIRALTAALSLVLLSAAERDPAYPGPPQVLFRDLFDAVQRAGIYPDSKTFADAQPDAAPEEILAQYHAVHPQSAPALKRFTDAHFSLPAQASDPLPLLAPQPISSHIDALWATLTRSATRTPAYASLLPLPQPYVVPGGRFRELYYWDSYFTMLGLEQSGRQDLVQAMVSDFAHLIDAYGHVPNGTRSYYLSRSQPPFFFEMVGLLSANDPAAAFAQYLPQLRREY
ncbi:MAG TPA: trehalase family glycosidase, partial [Steroidobacteraceae bacterium]